MMIQQVQKTGVHDQAYGACGSTFLQFPTHNFQFLLSISSHLLFDTKMEEL